VSLIVWTVGHSAQPLDTFLELLAGQQIEAVADVRRYPGSRAHPHFNSAPLALALAEQRMNYLPFPELGGRRATNPASANTVWRNAAFRAYADYMETPEFEAGLARFVPLAREGRTAIMCSEAVWWRCHRSLIADALKVSGVQVLHILPASRIVEHPYTSAARIVNGELTYGAGPG
jgi:uncharacterized protein (DUF488 family)